MNASILVLSLATIGGAPQDGVYDFYATWCGPCQRMMPVVSKLHAEGLPVFTVNSDERPDLVQQFGVNCYPTFVLVVGGREKQRVSGMQDEAALRALVAQVPRSAPRRSVPVVMAADEGKSSGWNFRLPLPAFPGKKDDVVQIEPAAQGSSTGSSSGAGSGTRLRGARVEPVRNTTSTRDTANSDDANMTVTTGDSSDPDRASSGRASAGPAGDLAARGRGASGRTARGGPPQDTTASEPTDDPSGTAESAGARMLASSVRIRVKDASGAYFGSGVVIDSAPGKSIVLTCGHVLRDVKRDGRIEIDVFDGNRSRTYRGTIVKFDLIADVGLIMIPTQTAVTASPIASFDRYVRVGDSTVSIGCSGGELPTVERLRVTTLNRYTGPDTIECTGVPVQGRSGGGLFTADGQVVGVCTNADPREKRGVYAGLLPIHELLRAAGLGNLAPSSSKPERDALADAADRNDPAKNDPAKDDPAASDVAHPSALESELAHVRPARPRSAGTGRRGSSRTQLSKVDEAALKENEEAEIVCIIRDTKHPQAASRVVIINRASQTFLSYLTGESQDQLVPTSLEARGTDDNGTASADSDREPTADADRGPSAKSARGRQRSGARFAEHATSPFDAADQAPRTSAAWKPTGSDLFPPVSTHAGADTVENVTAPNVAAEPATQLEFQAPIQARIPHRYVRSDESRP